MDGLKRGMQEVMAQLHQRTEQAKQNLSSETDDSSQKPNDVECSRCQDKTGWFEQQEQGETWVLCPNCYERKRMERLLKSSEITDSFRQITFGQFHTEGKPPIIQDMKDTAIDYYQQFPKIRHGRKNSLMYMGVAGSGKTHLLTALSNNLMNRREVNVQYFPYVEGFNDLRDDFDLLEKKMAAMKEAGVLFIDDLFKPVRGVPRCSEWELIQMYAVINHRYLNHLPVLISTELQGEALFEIDPALASRIIEMSKDFLVTVTGDYKQLNHRMEGVF